MKRLRTQWSYQVEPGSYEPESDKPSMTLPDQHWTIPELLEKFANTGSVPGELLREPEFDDAEHFEASVTRRPDLDLTDIDEAKNRVRWLTEAIETDQAEPEIKSKPDPETESQAKQSEAKDENKGDEKE